MKLLVDASVAVKWLVAEDRDFIALDILRDGFVLLAPDLLLTEVANALRNKVRSNLLGASQAKVGLTALPDYFDRLFGPVETLVAAFEMACSLNHPVADCVYIACAIQSDAVLLTDDLRLHQKAMTLRPKLTSSLLSDWTPGLPVSPAG
jgi:predicted nucleic acid-binding protein